MADSKEQLDADTETILSTARRHLCQLAVLKFQQTDGLNTVLPIGCKKIQATRTLTIQFEICEDNLTDKTYYKKAFSVATEYCAELCKIFGIAVDKIVGHCEAYLFGYGSNRGDPEHWMKNFGETMDDFRKAVSELLKDGGENTPNSANPKAMVAYEICEGDLVSIAKEAVYYSGATVPDWVKNQHWYVKEISGSDRVVIDKNESGTNSICSPISKKYLTVIKSVAVNNCNSESKEYPYLVKVTADVLDIRKGAGTNTDKVGSITDCGVYTIVAEENGTGASKWGKLKSGAGWISLDYTKKI